MPDKAKKRMRVSQSDSCEGERYHKLRKARQRVVSRYARGEAGGGGGGGGGVVSCPDREGKTVGCTRIGIRAQPIIYFLHPEIA